MLVPQRGRIAAPAKIADLTIDEIKELMREAGLGTLAELAGDSDEGKELRHGFIAEGRNSLAALESGGKPIPAE